MKVTKATQQWTAWAGLGALAWLGVVGAGGCADRNKDNVPESAATQGEVQNATERVGDAAENAAVGAAKTAEGLADAAVTTPKIKAALAANPALKGSRIDVDTAGTKDTVYLRGAVANAAQAKAAMTIAHKNAPGYKIVNELKVAAAKAAPAKKPS